ncbi:hypothetical protein ACIBEK_02405 [Nocardia fusca]
MIYLAGASIQTGRFIGARLLTVSSGIVTVSWGLDQNRDETPSVRPA